MKKTTKKLVSRMLILSMIVGSMVNGTTKQVQAAVNQEKLTSNYLNSSNKYLSLGGQGIKSYDFNIKKEAMTEGATYTWYVKTDKGNTESVTINKKTGMVTAKEAGTAYIRCKVTLANGTIQRPEAKVTVRNNITEVEINNLPKNLSITAGTKYNFNQTVLDTDAGKKEKTQGVTRWEVAEDTTGVKSVTDQGVVLPTKVGKFKIRAVCFQSSAKYKLWLANKKANKTYITAASEWVAIKVAAANETATASTQKQLNQLLKEDSITKITLSTEKALEFTIPKGDYSKKTLTVNAANADVKNYGTFKKITVNAIKDSTWIEFTNGNTFYLKDDATGFIVDKDVSVKLIVIDKEDSLLNIEVKGIVKQVIVLQNSKINITGSGTQIPVSVEETAAGSEITTSMPLKLELKAKTDITLNQGAEETSIDKSESKVVVKIENNTKKNSTITTNQSGSEMIGAGKTVVSNGTRSTTNSGASQAPSVQEISAISAITGTAQVGSVLTAGTLIPASATVSYQWQICATSGGTYANIVGATGSTYTPIVGDVGKYIKVVATGTGSYNGTATSNATTAVVPLPTHTGVLDNLAASVSLGGLLVIRLADLDIATSATPTVKVTSATDATGQSITLNWNSISSKFEGVIPVSATAGDRKVQATGGETITVTYHDEANASGSAADITKITSVVLPGYTGYLSLPYRIILDTASNITLTDLDLAITATPIVKVTSTKDSIGQDVTLHWNSTTSKFEGTIFVSATAGDGKIQAICNDTVNVTYHDSANASGMEQDITNSNNRIFMLVGTITGETDFGSEDIVISFADNQTPSADVLRITGLYNDVTISVSGLVVPLVNVSSGTASFAGFNMGNNNGNKPYITVTFTRPGHTQKTFNFTVTAADGGNLN